MNIAVDANYYFGCETKAYFPPKTSVYKMAMKLSGGLLENVSVQVKNPDGSMVVWSDLPHHLWKFVKVKLGDSLRIWVKPTGGDNSIFAAIAMVVVAVVAPYLAPVLFAGTALAGGAGAALLTIAGSYAVNALFPPPSPPANNNQAAQADSESQKLSNVNSDANPIALNSRLAWILGHRRVALHDVCQPHLYLENGRQVVTRVLALADEHEISELEIGGVSIDSLNDVEYEITSGAKGVATQKLVNSYSSRLVLSKSFTGFQSKENSDRLIDQTTPENSEPKPIFFTTKKPKNPIKINKLSEIAIRFSLSGLYDTSSLTKRAIQPIRISFWRKSDPDNKFRLPEMHIAARKTSAVIKEIKFRWDDIIAYPSPQSDISFTFFTTPASGDWDADNHFKDNNNSVNNIDRTVDGLNIQLDPEIHIKDEYEFEILAGQPIIQNNFNASDYELHGEVRNLFTARLDNGVYYLPSEDKSAASALSLQFVTTVVDEPPIQTTDIASVAIVSKNNDIQAVTALAGKVIDKRGDVENPWQVRGTSSNPADHLHYILKKWAELSDLDSRLIKSDEFVDWSLECEDKGYTTSFPVTGQSVADLYKIFCSTGMSTPKFDVDGFGITYFKDTRSDPAQMLFDARNCEDLSINLLDVETPSSIRSNFPNKENNWQSDTMAINNEFGKSAIGFNKLMDYPAIDDPLHLEKRITFDLLQEFYRPKKYIFKSGMAAHSLKKGDLIGLSTDLMTDYAHGFRLDHVINRNTIAVDRAIEVESVESNLLDVEDLLAEDNLSIVGGDSVVSILTPDGLEEHDIDKVHKNIIQLKTDINYSNLSKLEQTHVSAASKAHRYNRVIVFDVAREGESKAVVTCVDEACEIFEELERRFG